MRHRPAHRSGGITIFDRGSGIIPHQTADTGTCGSVTLPMAKHFLIVEELQLIPIRPPA